MADTMDVSDDAFTLAEIAQLIDNIKSSEYDVRPCAVPCRACAALRARAATARSR